MNTPAPEPVLLDLYAVAYPSGDIEIWQHLDHGPYPYIGRYSPQTIARLTERNAHLDEVVNEAVELDNAARAHVGPPLDDQSDGDPTFAGLQRLLALTIDDYPVETGDDHGEQDHP